MLSPFVWLPSKTTRLSNSIFLMVSVSLVWLPSKDVYKRQISNSHCNDAQQTHLTLQRLFLFGRRNYMIIQLLTPLFPFCVNTVLMQIFKRFGFHLHPWVHLCKEKWSYCYEKQRCFTKKRNRFLFLVKLWAQNILLHFQICSSHTLNINMMQTNIKSGSVIGTGSSFWRCV